MPDLLPEVPKTVLFVDDDVDVRKTAELLLRSAGYGYSGAGDPGEAMSQLAAGPVDVILLDLNFSRAQTSGAEGLSLLRDILRHDPHAVVIVVTAAEREAKGQGDDESIETHQLNRISGDRDGRCGSSAHRI